MSKFNRPMSIGQQLANHPDATVNHEGGLAFTLDGRSRLYTRVLSSFCGEPKYYKPDGAADFEALRQDVHDAAAVSPEFPLRLAAYARQVMGMRSTAIVTLTEAAAIPECRPFVRRWTPAIVQRADEPCEVVAAWTLVHGDIGARKRPGLEHRFPDSLRKGLSDALAKFDEYQLAKYDRDGAVTLRDALRICRPTPKTPEQAALYKYLVKGEVDATLLPKLTAKQALLRKDVLDDEALMLADQAHVTWEVLTSKFGSGAATWNAIRFPLFAGVRNLANLMRSGADLALDRVLAMLRNPTVMQRSKLFPHNLFAAYKLIESGMRTERTKHGVTLVADPKVANHPRRGEVLEALAEAIALSVANLPHLGGTSFLTSDNSGSMRSTLSEHSTVQHVDVANLLAAVSYGMCERAIASVFGETHAIVPVVRKDSIFTNMRRLAETDVGYSTNAYLAIRHLTETRTWVDRIVLCSDVQCYGDGSLAEELRRYRSAVNPKVYLYSVDLAGYGTSQFPQDEPRVALLAGWSDKLLQLIPQFEAEAQSPVDRIAAWTPAGFQEEPEADAA